jgi:radical SAM protein with 4Fe4S-binding SPASM domain
LGNRPGWARRARIQRVLFQQFKITTRNAACRQLRLLPDQQGALFATIRRLSRRHGLMPLIDCSLFPLVAAAGVSRRDLEFFDIMGCQGGNAFASVDVDGMLRPCSFWPEPLAPAAGLDAATWYDHPGFTAFRASRPAQCSGCALVDLCSSPCRLPGFELTEGPACFRA